MITAKQIFNDLNKAQRAKVMDYLRTNPSSMRIFKTDFKDAFYEDLIRRRDGQIEQHIITNTFGETGCLGGSTLLKGDPLRIGVRNNHEIIKTFSLDFKTGKIVPSKSEVLYSGKKKVYRIQFDDGRFVDVTKDHKFFVKKVGKIIEREVKWIRKGTLLLTEDGYDK